MIEVGPIPKDLNLISSHGFQNSLRISLLAESDIPMLVARFAEHNWIKPQLTDDDLVLWFTKKLTHTSEK